MSKPTTHVLMIVDKSGSMAPLAGDVRGGFNTYLDMLAADAEGKYRLTVALFDDEYRPLCVAAKLKDVPRLDGTSYQPGGYTALNDAIGKTIAEFEGRVPELADGDRVLLVVQTDGAENSSTEYSHEAVEALIEQREEAGRWSCLFLGAGIDAWTQASQLGFARGSTISTQHTAAGTHATYGALAGATGLYSRGGSGAEAAALVADATSTGNGAA
jgi:hypothetical protein